MSDMWIASLGAAGLATTWYAAIWWFIGLFDGPADKTDGYHYAILRDDGKTVRPFHYRWLVPKLDSLIPGFWYASRFFALIGTAALLPVYVSHFTTISWQDGLFAAALFLGFFGLFNEHVRVYDYIDAQANFLALAAGTAWLYEIWWLAIVLTVLVACTKEIGPLYVAIYALTPLPLLGLVFPAVRHFVWPPEAPSFDGIYQKSVVLIALSPIRGVWLRRRARGTTPLAIWYFVYPWGVGLLGLLNANWWLVGSVAIGYLFLVVGTDFDRLYFPFFYPALIVATVQVVPSEAYLLLGFLHVAWGAHMFMWHYGEIPVSRPTQADENKIIKLASS